ncbi:blister [Abeliophyllum distichum]|uniref:Blister n=1 Tax=Abeliophyllum distichum TaxID=126358 RepID=A0ABD1Q047_9LAMI
MASAQVLRKKEHLEAGKKKLEEFRRKKAAERAKKATATNQLHASDGDLHEKQPSETKCLLLTDYNPSGTSDAVVLGGLESSGIITKNEIKETDNAQTSDFSFSNNTNATLSFSASNNDVNSSVLAYSHLIDKKFTGDAATVGTIEPTSANYKPLNTKENDGSTAGVASGTGNDQFLTHHVPSFEEIHSVSSRSIYHGSDERPSENSDGYEKDLSHSSTYSVSATNTFPENSVSALLQGKSVHSEHETSSMTSSSYPEFSMVLEVGDNKFTGSVAHTGNANKSSPWPSDNLYTGFSNDAQSSSNHALPSTPAVGRRSRPSFLDSINISRAPSASSPLFGSAKADSSSSKVHSVHSSGSSISQNAVDSSIVSGNGVGLFNHVMESSMENRHNFYSQKEDEGFAALEQHIEDLTREKFSLQQALEASRTLAQSLTAENSALTDSYNQQGGIVNQLKSDMGELQEEIKAQLVEIEALKIDYANAQLECNAADERAKLLASEVIGLEDKALGLRSNELKLVRQLENSQTELSSYRKKMSSLEKECQDLQSTIDALQEEKKLLQSKVRKAYASGKSVDIKRSTYNKKDVSTSTEDLDTDTITEPSNLENYTTASHRDDAPNSHFPHENKPFSYDSLSLTIPSDHMRMIQNINTLIAELALEKEQLVQALSAESSQSNKLMELNKDLSLKLEAQTQRLELLMSQSMANDNFLARQPDPRTLHDNTAYADEGDEVVERVLGWIMKLFPGGPSRRRSSKLV